MLLIDSRWTGLHGIARFASEVVSRITLHHRPLGGPRSPLSPFDLVNTDRLRLGADDVVFSPGFNAGLTRARQILTVHDLIHLEDAHESSLAKRVYYERVVKPAARHAGRVLTVSPESKAAIEKWLDDAEVEVIDVGNGCADLFFETPDRPARAIGDLLYVGNMKPHKNPEVLFGALAHISDATLTVVTKNRARAEELARTHGVDDRVAVISGCDDETLRDLYHGHRTLALPSRSEGFGLPAVEAIACGLPVVYWTGCAPVGSIVDRHGLSVDDPDDPGSWAQTLQTALAGATEQKDRGAPAAWHDRYSWDAVTQRVEKQLSRE